MSTAREWLAAQGSASSFAFLHLYEPHFPYEPPVGLSGRNSSSIPTRWRWCNERAVLRW